MLIPRYEDGSRSQCLLALWSAGLPPDEGGGDRMEESERGWEYGRYAGSETFGLGLAVGDVDVTSNAVARQGLNSGRSLCRVSQVNSALQESQQQAPVGHARMFQAIFAASSIASGCLAAFPTTSATVSLSSAGEMTRLTKSGDLDHGPSREPGTVDRRLAVANACPCPHRRLCFAGTGCAWATSGVAECFPGESRDVHN